MIRSHFLFINQPFNIVDIQFFEKNMKSSLYNTFLKVTKDSTVIYNAYEDKTIVCKGDININNILLQSKSLHMKLESEGFIVPENKDEYHAYVKAARKAEDDDNSFHLLINPTLNCNFKSEFF